MRADVGGFGHQNAFGAQWIRRSAAAFTRVHASARPRGQPCRAVALGSDGAALNEGDHEGDVEQAVIRVRPQGHVEDSRRATHAVQADDRVVRAS